jgi:hypothetical protein
MERRKFTREFKLEAVRLIKERGVSYAQARRQQHYARPLHVALRCRRCPAASLKHLAYLRLEPNLSCFGNHPDLES